MLLNVKMVTVRTSLLVYLLFAVMVDCRPQNLNNRERRSYLNMQKKKQMLARNFSLLPYPRTTTSPTIKSKFLDPEDEQYQSPVTQNSRGSSTVPVDSNSAANLVKEVLKHLGQEFLASNLSELFIFGQYVGNSMKNMTSENRLKMQRSILELILKYQAGSHDDVDVVVPTVAWSDFNMAKI